MSVLRSVAAFGVACFLALPAQADPRQPPTVEYSATLVLTQDGQSPVTQKVFYSQGRLRTEQVDSRGMEVTIVDGPKKMVTILYRTVRGYEQWEHDGSDPGAPMAGQDIRIEKLGEEAVNGIPAVKNKISGKTPEGKEFEMTVWTSKENIQLKMAGTDTIDGKSVAIGAELKDVKVGPQAPALFAVPAGYRKAPAGAPSTPPAPPKK